MEFQNDFNVLVNEVSESFFFYLFFSSLLSQRGKRQIFKISRMCFLFVPRCLWIINKFFCKIKEPIVFNMFFIELELQVRHCFVISLQIPYKASTSYPYFADKKVWVRKIIKTDLPKITQLIHIKIRSWRNLKLFHNLRRKKMKSTHVERISKATEFSIHRSI